MDTLQKFIRNHSIRMEVEWTDSNPNMDSETPMNHYKCLLRRKRKQMTVIFSMGLGHSREPTAEDVLDCLASDSASLDGYDCFEDWAESSGFDPDSRKAERIYKACLKQATRLNQFLGNDAYHQLLWETERL